MAEVSNSKVTESKNLGILDQSLEITSEEIQIKTVQETFNKVTERVRSGARISSFLDVLGRGLYLLAGAQNYISDAVF